MIGFKLDRVESWLNEETMEKKSKLWRQNNSLSKRGGAGRKGGAS